MKRILAIILAAFLSLSAFSVLSFASDTEENPGTEAAKSLAVEWYKENGFEFEAEVSLYDDPYATSTHIWLTSDACATEIPLTDTFPLMIKGIYDFNNGVASLYLPSFPFFFLEFTADESDAEYLRDLVTNSIEINDSNFVKSYEDSGYYIEEIKYDNETLSYFYFKDGKLVKIENFDENNIKENTIEIISTHVKEKDLRVPFFAINITPIFNLIFG